MFKATAGLFLYAVSPVHMGAGTAIGAIDNPIQRERHTGHPIVAGSGLKGALRHEAEHRWRESSGSSAVAEIFGPDTARSSDHAGALSFGDAQLVAFPVRSLRQSYVYATCPTALARVFRLLGLAGVQVGAPWQGFEAASAWPADECVVLAPDLLQGEFLVLEAFRFHNQDDVAVRGAVAEVASWLAANALPSDPSFEYFRNKMSNHLVLLSDDRFNYFVRNSTTVEPHVRIDDESGTADDGGLFYTENLPPESLLVSLVMASDARSNGRRPAGEVLNRLMKGPGEGLGFDERLVQVGGDATSGRGHVVLRFAGRDM